MTRMAANEYRELVKDGAPVIIVPTYRSNMGSGAPLRRLGRTVDAAVIIDGHPAYAECLSWVPLIKRSPRSVHQITVTLKPDHDRLVVNPWLWVGSLIVSGSGRPASEPSGIVLDPHKLWLAND